MKLGVWFYGLGNVFTGVLMIVWGAFDPSHQPIKALGNVPGQQILAYLMGIGLIAAGAAIFWRRTEKVGAAASVVAYILFTLLWLARYSSSIRARGWGIAVLLGVTFGLAQQVMLLAPAVIVYVSTASPKPTTEARAVVVSRWMLGLPPVIFGLFHLVGLRVFATIVPAWMHLGYFWAALTGLAFIASGLAICFRKMDVWAASMLALMLLLFEALVEIPPILVRLHSEPTWGAAIYNVSAIGACLIFVEYVARRADREPARI